MKQARDLIAALALGALCAAPALAQTATDTGGATPNPPAPPAATAPQGQAAGSGSEATEPRGNPGGANPGAANPAANPLPNPRNFQQAQIARIQQELADQGLYTGKVDGLMGPETRKGLADFQSANGLKPTGSLDVATVAKLREMEAANNTNNPNNTTQRQPNKATQALNPQQERAQAYQARRSLLTRPRNVTGPGAATGAAIGPNYANPSTVGEANYGATTAPAPSSGVTGYFGYGDMSNGFNAATGRR